MASVGITENLGGYVTLVDRPARTYQISNMNRDANTLPDAILEKFERDRELALASGKERACGNKIRYATMVHATKAVYNLEVKSPGEILDPYECPFCGYYHIGHSMEPTIRIHQE